MYEYVCVHIYKNYTPNQNHYMQTTSKNIFNETYKETWNRPHLTITANFIYIYTAALITYIHVAKFAEFHRNILFTFPLIPHLQ